MITRAFTDIRHCFLSETGLDYGTVDHFENFDLHLVSSIESSP